MSVSFLESPSRDTRASEIADRARQPAICTEHTDCEGSELEAWRTVMLARLGHYSGLVVDSVSPCAGPGRSHAAAPARPGAAAAARHESNHGHVDSVNLPPS